MIRTKGKELLRIGDFTDLAKEGKKIQITVNLRRQQVWEGAMPMYLFRADYALKTGDPEKEKVVSKIYMYSSREESLDESMIDKNIANDRLKQDYKRLKEAGIEFEEKFF